MAKCDKLSITSEDLKNVEREYCKRSLAAFARLAWPILEPGQNLRWGWCLDAICEHLEAVSRGKINRLLMNVPPGSMKSLLTSVFWPAWEWGPNGRPELRVIGTAHEEGLAIRDSRRCRDLIKSEWYQDLWPISLSKDLDGKREFGNDKKGVRQARSFPSMTGVRGDIVILDDPISADAANSAAKLEAARVTFTETLPTRLNNENSAIVVIMQRLNARDTSGVILDMKMPYVHLKIPMRFEGDNTPNALGWRDPRTKIGELMFPERFDEGTVSLLEKALGSYATAGQLQQRPVARGGGLIKLDWFRYWEVRPALEWRVICADTAQKTAQQNDYSVFQCWGRSLAGQAVLLDQIRGKWEAPDLVVQARAFWLKHAAAQVGAAAGQLRALYVEDKVSGTGLIQTLRREGIPILPIQRSTDKFSRGGDAAPFLESGNVLIPQDAPWLSDFLTEAESFPGANDDQMDPFFDAVKIVQTIPAQQKNIPFVPIANINKWR